MIVRPIELRDANAFVAAHHRHHAPAAGHRFSISAWNGDDLVGVCIVGRPVARSFNPLEVCEVTRLCTDGTRNACSILYAAAARAAGAMGYRRIQTYTLPEEGGASLRGAGWTNEGERKGKPWKYHEAQRCLPGLTNRRTDQPNGTKVRWSQTLRKSLDTDPDGG